MITSGGNRNPANPDSPIRLGGQDRRRFGNVEGDPFIAHVDRPGTPLSVALHGTGTWSPATIAGSLGGFYALVAAWSSLMIEDFDGERQNKDRDFEVKDRIWHVLELKLAPVLAEHEMSAFARTWRPDPGLKSPRPRRALVPGRFVDGGVP